MAVEAHLGINFHTKFHMRRVPAWRTTFTGPRRARGGDATESCVLWSPGRMSGARASAANSISLAQRRALLKAASEVGQAVRDLLEAAALTGARAGELVRATVSQFNAREGSMAFITGKQRKNGGRRDVPLFPAAVRLLRRLAGGNAPDAHLFLRDDGRRWAHSDCDEPIREAATRAKLPAEPHIGFCAHTLRHCWITDTLRAGMSVLEVARLAGTSVQMLNDHYGHLVAHAARAKLARVRLT
ncbi:MAG: site-specific integrase [Steroidobacteraceae bacterium]